MLIIAILILIGVVAALSGYIIGQNQQSVNNTTNLSAANNTTENNTQVNQTDYIGKAKAKQIAQAFLKEYQITDYEIRSIDLVIINGVPLYRVSYWDYYITIDGTESGWDEVYVGAKDGKLYDAYGNRATDV